LFDPKGRPILAELEFRHGVGGNPVGYGAIPKVGGILGTLSKPLNQNTQYDGKDSQSHQHLDQRETTIHDTSGVAEN